MIVISILARLDMVHRLAKHMVNAMRSSENIGDSVPAISE
jgi:hypothetical protein